MRRVGVAGVALSGKVQWLFEGSEFMQACPAEDCGGVSHGLVAGVFGGLKERINSYESKEFVHRTRCLRSLYMGIVGLDWSGRGIGQGGVHRGGCEGIRWLQLFGRGV
jgi:hypothetical protein